MSSVFGFPLRTRFTRVARRATPPLSGYCLSLAGKGSICEWVSLVWRIVISVSPALTSNSGELIADHNGIENDGNTNRGNAIVAPPASEALRNVRLVIMAVAPPLPARLLYQK